MIKAIILDFDGVILESVSVKTEAFRTLFSNKSNYIDTIVNYHVNNGGMSRYDKFRYIYTNILKEPLCDEDFDILCQQFSELIYNGIISSPFVTGTLNFLEKSYKKYPLYIVSATPEQELFEIIKNRGIEKYFNRIYGAPKKKSDCIAEIIQSRKCSAKSIIFIGDAINDWKAAEKTKIRFIGRIKPGELNIFKDLSNVEKVIYNLDDLRNFVETESENI